MPNILPLIKPPNIKRLVTQLKSQTDDVQRVTTLNNMIDYLAYTEVKRAQILLAEQKKILDNFSHPDLLLKYHLNSAFVENQLYNFALAQSI